MQILIAALCTIILFVAVPAARAQDAPAPDRPLTVAVKVLEPMVIRGESRFIGFSIDLWEALARQIGADYRLMEVETVADQIAAVREGAADLAITGITITAAREAQIDFSHSYFDAGLQILVADTTQASLTDVLQTIFSPGLLGLIGFFFLSIIVAGHILWLMERNANQDDFPKAYLPGVFEAVWWAAVTVTTVGYGDKTPKGRIGRAFGIVWMIMGIVLLAQFTAGVTASLTVQQIRGVIQDANDLPGKRIAAVTGTTSAAYLESRGLRMQTTATFEEATALLLDGTVQAVIYDAPTVRYYAAQTDGVHVVEGVLTREDYGIALPTNSPLRESLNEAILTLREDGTYDSIYLRWFGSG
jgi:ABC-type amino acid transport substrate-binding protein